jgi:hypothetical protein
MPARLRLRYAAAITRDIFAIIDCHYFFHFLSILLIIFIRHIAITADFRHYAFLP